MSIPRFRNKSIDEVTVIPIIIENFFDISKIGIFSSIPALRAKLKDCPDIVGMNGVEVSLMNALCTLSETGGYIPGWEYLASPIDDEELNICKEIDVCLSPYNLLINQFKSSGRMLQSVMKWVFISNNTSNFSEGSDWHFDPIGSSAWMVQLVGSKRWTVLLADGSVILGDLRPSDLLLLPPGLEHKVENAPGENIAISHNWIDSRNCERMWNEVDRALSTYSTLEALQEGTDNLLFGLIMVLTRNIEMVQSKEIIEKLKKLKI